MNILNPAVSLIAAFFYSLLISFTIFEIYYFVPILFILILYRIFLIKIFKKLLFLNIFIFLFFLTLLFNHTFSEAFLIFIRINTILLFNITLFFSSNAYDIIRALNMLKIPKIIVSTIYFTLKMIEYLNKELIDIKNILKTRAFRAKNSLFTYETFGNIIGRLLVKSIRKSNALNNTFLTRGFNGDIYLINRYSVNKNDYFLLILVLLILLIKVIK